MALGVLMIFYIVLTVIGLIIQFLLYKGKRKTNNSIFIINMLFAIFLSYISYTALPTNYTGQKLIAIVWSVIAILAVLLKLTTNKPSTLSKLMLSLSIIGNILLIYLS